MTPQPPAPTVRPVEAADREWVLNFLRERWGSDCQVAHGEVLYPADHAGYIASHDGHEVGLVAYRICDDECEITLIDCRLRFAGIGTALLNAVEEKAQRSGCARLWLVTTNDNMVALRFYQRRGFVLSALRPDALSRSRELKPEIPAAGEFGIPLRDEIELEKPLT